MMAIKAFIFEFFYVLENGEKERRARERERGITILYKHKLIKEKVSRTISERKREYVCMKTELFYFKILFNFW